jgi:monothiol glutaredoxin
MREELKNSLEDIIHNHPVVLFMKGTPERPQCGFSKQVVDVLRRLVPNFASVDVLSDPEIREGIKAYSSWPTIPQLYVDKEFIGGCDIVLDLYKNGQLNEILKIKRSNHPPKMDITDGAAVALKRAFLDCQGDEAIRIDIGADFSHSLSFDIKQDDDFILQYDGFSILIDPYSAVRAESLHIDYVKENLDEGFAFNNPNEPPLVQEISVEELKAWMDDGQDALLIDVRPKEEWQIANISKARLLEEIDAEEISSISPDQPLVFHCHHGNRSRRTAESFRHRGFKKLFNLKGGIDAWSRRIDQSIPTYN